MRCARCDELIREGEQYTTYDNPGASFAGSTVYRHATPCPRVQTQTAPKPTRQPSLRHR
ncbi:hypothetical protein [Streptomyces sp. NPDC093984]|uniref:hypothetical protein n=1 Tax=Streptomyces sp. NPDC093984 TaxID=3366052 RepID=UPI0037F2405C